MANKKIKLFETRYFGFVIGLLVFLLCLLVQSFAPIKILDQTVLDAHFNLRNLFVAKTLQVGVTEQEHNPNISDDILIVGVDNRSLARFGKWPWPRYRHADFLNSLARIKDQNQRERSVLLDFFFVEPSSEAENDSLLAESMKENGRLYLETILDRQPSDPGTIEEQYGRHYALFQNQAPIKNIQGDISNMPIFYGMQAPLKPFARAAHGHGHPTFFPDIDNTFRRQAMVARTSHLLAVIPVDSLKSDLKLDTANFERLGWTDNDGLEHTVPYPLTDKSISDLKAQLKLHAPPVLEDTDGDGKPDKEYNIVYQYRDYFLPAITLALALDYFHKTTADVQIKIGEYVLIPSPQKFNTQTGQWEPYKIETKAAVYDDNQQLIHPAEYRPMPEIKIPIDDTGSMLINFMGQASGDSISDYQTFPVRSYAGYAARATSSDPQTWPETLALGNKIVMAGAFSQGMASDEKKTPFGLMYGIEMHANALNTILMDKFIYPLPGWSSTLLLFSLCMIVAFFTSRLGPPIALGLSLLLILVFFIVTTLVFDADSLFINFALPSFAMLVTFIAIVAYRGMTEEREKRAIQTMFGKYVSKTVVDQMISLGQQPELGGVDKELTVFFSDIRGFTTLSESMTPQELVNHLNTYLAAMTDIIMEFEGTLDKYVGDEVMCFWGAPVPQLDHAFLACKCAVRQMEKLAELNSSWPPEKRIDIGIGINSGIMTVGNMGSLGRMNYTLMGDNVNLGARLEGTNKEYKSHIIISEYTYGLVRDKVIVRELDNIRVKGKNKPVLIYELVEVLDD